MMLSQQKLQLQHTYSTNAACDSPTLQKRKHISRSMPKVQLKTPQKKVYPSQYNTMLMWTDYHRHSSFREEPITQIQMFRQKLQLKHHVRSLQPDMRIDNQAELVFAHFSNTYSTAWNAI